MRVTITKEISDIWGVGDQAEKEIIGIVYEDPHDFLDGATWEFQPSEEDMPINLPPGVTDSMIPGNRPEDVNDLKSCPFCGGQPETYWDHYDKDECYCEGYNITCCVVNIFAINKEDAVRNWNTRYNDNSQIDLIHADDAPIPDEDPFLDPSSTGSYYMLT